MWSDITLWIEIEWSKAASSVLFLKTSGIQKKINMEVKKDKEPTYNSKCSILKCCICWLGYRTPKMHHNFFFFLLIFIFLNFLDLHAESAFYIASSSTQPLLYSQSGSEEIRTQYSQLEGKHLPPMKSTLLSQKRGPMIPIDQHSQVFHCSTWPTNSTYVSKLTTAVLII